MTLDVELRLPPHWAHISPVHDFLTDLVRARVGDAAAQALSTLARELLENAVKYGNPQVDLVLAMQINAHASSIELTLTNAAVASRTLLLKQVVGELEKMDAEDALPSAMSQHVRKGWGATMGLARLRSELGAIIRVAEEAGLVSVTASVGWG